MLQAVGVLVGGVWWLRLDYGSVQPHQATHPLQEEVRALHTAVRHHSVALHPANDIVHGLRSENVIRKGISRGAGNCSKGAIYKAEIVPFCSYYLAKSKL